MVPLLLMSITSDNHQVLADKPEYASLYNFLAEVIMAAVKIRPAPLKASAAERGV